MARLTNTIERSGLLAVLTRAPLRWALFLADTSESLSHSIVQMCAFHCKSLGYDYAGTQFGVEVRHNTLTRTRWYLSSRKSHQGRVSCPMYPHYDTELGAHGGSRPKRGLYCYCGNRGLWSFPSVRLKPFALQCWCSDDYDRYGQTDRCDHLCAGDHKQYCGGHDALTVYATE